MCLLPDDESCPLGASQLGDVTLSRIMQNVSFRYARYINRSRKQVGHLFQGRYKALLIDADSLSARACPIHPQQSCARRTEQDCGRIPLEQSQGVSGKSEGALADNGMDLVSV